MFILPINFFVLFTKEKVFGQAFFKKLAEFETESQGFYNCKHIFESVQNIDQTAFANKTIFFC